VITLSHDKYEASIEKIQESYRKSRRVADILRLEVILQQRNPPCKVMWCRALHWRHCQATWVKPVSKALPQVDSKLSSQVVPGSGGTGQAGERLPKSYRKPGTGIE
jgi:hypothetical protein